MTFWGPKSFIYLQLSNTISYIFFCCHVYGIVLLFTFYLFDVSFSIKFDGFPSLAPQV